jgi:hypothetical protein
MRVVRSGVEARETSAMLKPFEKKTAIPRGLGFPLRRRSVHQQSACAFALQFRESVHQTGARVRCTSSWWGPPEGMAEKNERNKRMQARGAGISFAFFRFFRRASQVTSPIPIRNAQVR